MLEKSKACGGIRHAAVISSLVDLRLVPSVCVDSGHLSPCRSIDMRATFQTKLASKRLIPLIRFHQSIISYDVMILTKEIHARSREVMLLQLLLML